MNMFSKVFGTRSQREVKRIMPLVKKIEDLRPEMQKLTDEELRGKTREFKKRLKRELPWMIFYQRHLLPSVRLPSEYWEWSISKYSSSVESYFTRVVLPR